MRSPSRFEKLGMRQIVKRAWLDVALRGACEGLPEAEVRARLTHELALDETAHGKRGAAQFSKNMALLASWFAPKDDLGTFVGQLVAQAKEVGESQWGPLHWAVLAGSYPFFLCVTTVVGRLLALQEVVSKAQVQRRVEEVYGTPGMLERNLRYALVNLINLGLLATTERIGVYARAPLVVVEDDRTALLLWKAVLHGTKGGRASLAAIRNSPAFYAFSMPLVYPAQFREAFDDADTAQYAGVDEQLFLKEETTK